MNLYKIEWALSLLSKYSHIVLEEGNDITKTNMLFIIHLYHRPNIHQDQLAEMFKMNRSSVTRSIQTLKEMHWGESVLDHENKRANLVKLTTLGEEKYKSIMNQLLEWIGVLTKDMTPEEVQTGMNFLEKMTANACKTLGDHHIIQLMERM
ncbi:MAG: winged helix-turn-helix transcriptional regulator [Clostridia bacterium]|nr:winged helix-turn-helix transcriptional regulator [Clostridia bacterium]